MLISDGYRALNAQLHAANAGYGTSGGKWAAVVDGLARKYECHTVLDYGCGRGTLAASLPASRHYRIAEYDPAIVGKDHRPESADLVVCGDVLEHIEPDCLDAVLDDLRDLSRKVTFLVVATRPAVKFLADGRNAHLIVEPLAWWFDRIQSRWEIQALNNQSGEFVCIGVPK